MLTSNKPFGRLTTVASTVRLALRVFLVFTIIYLCSWAGHYTSGDGRHKVAWARVMLFSSDPIIQPDQYGAYSKYGIGHTLLAIPPLFIANFIQKTTGIRTEAALYTLIFVINGALFLALVAYYLAHFYPSRVVWWTVFVIGLATIWWPYTKMDFSEPLVLTTVFLGFVIMRFGSPFLGLVVAGFSMTIRPDAPVILLPLVLWYIWSNRSLASIVKVALALAPSLALDLFANYIRYHSIMDQGYADERFSNLFPVGLYGILLSSGKSVFLFSPPLILGILGWRRFAQQEETKRDAWLFLGMFVAEVLFYAKWWDWSSDDSWGDRFVLPASILLCIPMITVLHRRMLVIPVAAAGLSVQLLAVTVGGLDFLLLLRSSRPERHAVFMDTTVRMDFEDLWFNPNYSQIAGNWILLRYLLHIPPKPGNPDEVEEVGTRLWDAIPPETWRAAAHWDFIWSPRRTTAVTQRASPVVAVPQ